MSPRPVENPLARLSRLLAVVTLLAALAPGAGARPAARVPEHPGPLTAGRTRLPNGWTLAPAGRLVTVSDLPQALAVSPDGRWAASTSGSWEGGSLDLVEIASGRRVQTLRSKQAWLGVTFFANGSRLAVTAGLDNRVDLYDLSGGRAVRTDSIVLGPAWSAGGQYPQGRTIDYGPGAIWPTGIAADDASGRLFVVSRFDSSLRVLDVAGRTVTNRVRLPGVPYACLPVAHGRVAVSLWSAARLALVDASDGSVTALVPVGEHPSDLAESADGRLFVANANEDTVSVVDPAAGRVIETITTSLDRRPQSGVTPDGVALDAVRKRLYVANADSNCVTVVDVSDPRASRPVGFIPAGWYPTGAAARAGRRHDRGRQRQGHARRPPPTIAPPDTGGWCGYLLYNLRGRGALSIVPAPTPGALARWTRDVLASVPRPARARAVGAGVRGGGGRAPDPARLLRLPENRSYDQVLGDLPLGDGDSSRCASSARP